MAADDPAGAVAGAVKKSARKAGATAKRSARSAGKAAGDVRESVRKASDATASSAQGAAKATSTRVRRAAATVKATRAARAGLVKDARQVAEDADLQEGTAAEAIEKAEALHYDVVVNKRSMSVRALTRTLNDRWENGWSLAHVFEQRGNTVLVFEKRE